MKSLEDLEYDALQKIKLIEEIEEIRKPVWKKTPFISVVATLTIAFTTITLTTIENKNTKIAALEKEKQVIEEEKRKLEGTKIELVTLNNETTAEKAIILSEKANAISDKTLSGQQFQEWKLSQREAELKKSIKYFEAVSKNLALKTRGYKEGFIENYVGINKNVREDILKYSNEANRTEFEEWIKKKLLFTALNSYEDYVIKQRQESGLMLE